MGGLFGGGQSVAPAPVATVVSSRPSTGDPDPKAEKKRVNSIVSGMDENHDAVGGWGDGGDGGFDGGDDGGWDW